MIDRREIIEAAKVLSLLPKVVEKDYVLGWVLAGIYARPELASSWIFKGGTCLKKCFFETYRFSEDLDFTITDPGMIEEQSLKTIFGEICEWVYEHSGIETFPDLLRFEVYENPRGEASCQGRFYYRGPISPRGDPPMIKLDLTSDEVVVLEPAIRDVSHPYSDVPSDQIRATCYAFEEIFGEKIRALGERCRPRDLYDVIHLHRLGNPSSTAPMVLRVLKRKCEFKGIDVPTLALLEPMRQELDTAWSQMLAHQLQVLPNVDGFWRDLPDLIKWLESSEVRPKLGPVAAIGAGAPVGRRELRIVGPGHETGGSVMESVFFAAANQLCVDLTYKRRVRRIEPYSLRRTKDGRLLLYAAKADTGEIRAYRVDRIEGASVTDQAFLPRHVVELTSSGPMSIPPARARRGSKLPTTKRRSRSPSFSGVRFVHECPMCGRRFTRKTRSNSLRRHKDKSGYPCPGRRTILVDTKW